MRPEALHQFAPLPHDTPTTAAAALSDIPEHTSPKNSSRTSTPITRIPTNNTTHQVSVASTT